MLFLRSDVTEGEKRIYSDNIALARWMQEEISNTGEFADQTIPVIDAVSSRTGDTTYFWTEHIDTDEESIALTWFDFGEPFGIGVAAGNNPDRLLGWSAVFVPARKAQLTLRNRRLRKALSGAAGPADQQHRRTCSVGNLGPSLTLGPIAFRNPSEWGVKRPPSAMASKLLVLTLNGKYRGSGMLRRETVPCRA